MGNEDEQDDVEVALALLDAARRRFVAVVGHELRTPVTTLRGLAEELAVAGTHGRDDLAAAILRNAQRVERLLDDLLLATDIITALPVGDPEPVDLVAVAQATWDALDTGETLVLTGEREAVVSFRPGAADTLLERVLDNARRYGKPPFELRATTSGGRTTLEVASGGAQLSADDAHLAFELFYRGEGAVTTAPGFGLGLPVARALARQHDGELQVEPQAGGGLTVRIDVPSPP